MEPQRRQDHPDIETMPRSRGRGRQRLQTVPEFGLSAFGASSAMRSHFADPLPSILEPPIAWEPEFELDNRLRKENFPPRPRKQPGTRYSGRAIRIVANSFEIALRSGTVYHYDAEISPSDDTTTDLNEEKSVKKKYRALSNKLNRKVMDRLFPVTKNGVFGNVLPAYDGKNNLFTTKRLQFGNSESFRTTVKVDFEDESKNFQVTFKFAAEINLESLKNFYERRSSSTFPQSVVMALDIVFRHYPSLVFTPIGRCLFLRPTQEELAREGHIGTKDLWSGYYQSVRPGENAPILNIDRAKTLFYSPLNLITFVEKALDVSLERKMFLNDTEVMKLSRELKGVQVYSTHLGQRKRYRILRLRRERPDEIEFTIKRNDAEEFKTNVLSYFQQQYNIELRYPNLPCLQMHPESKFVCLPLELCEIVEGQHYRKRLAEDDLRAFIKLTTVKPVQRFNEIVNCVETHVRSADPWLDEFGVRQVNLAPMEFNARVIDAPNLRYERENMPGIPFDETKPYIGSWNVDGKRFLDGAAIDNRWVIIYFDRRLKFGGTIRNFAAMLVEEGTKRGMTMDMPVEYMHVQVKWGDPMESLQRAFRETKEHYGAVLAVIVLERKDCWYQEVKRAGDVLVGLTTQCVVQNNIEISNPRRTMSVVSNIVQKLNAKLGGRNHSFVSKEFLGTNSFGERILIMGVGVTHPPPFDISFPSIAAAVGSVDDTFTRYVSTVKIQESGGKIESRVQLIKELKDMAKKLIVEFEKIKRCKPDKIIIYRYGASEGQFKEVRDFEVSAIWNACLELGGSHYRPKMTFVIAQRRHHFRFRPKNVEDGVGACKNVPPGTIVDSHITHPRDFDFFLCSHLGIQGTSRPTHYYVLWDDNMFTSDLLQRLTYNLCHVSQRCTRAISVPAPVFYAELVATRARKHLSSALGMEDVSSSGSSGPSMESLSEEMKKSILLHDDLRTSMNFV